MLAQLVRITLEVGDLAHATDFYSRLLATTSHPVGGGRIYLDCAPPPSRS